MSIARPTLEESTINHAERFGSQLVYETAAESYLEAAELGLLSLALQRLDRRWRLRTTLHRLRQGGQRVPEAAQTASDPAQPRGAHVSPALSPTSDTRRRQMRHRTRQRPSQRAARPRFRR